MYAASNSNPFGFSRILSPRAVLAQDHNRRKATGERALASEPAHESTNETQTMPDAGP